MYYNLITYVTIPNIGLISYTTWMQRNEKEKDAIKVAREYVANIRNTYKPSVPHFSKTPVLSKNNYCKNHTNCIGNHSSDFVIPLIFCKKKGVPQQTHTSANCNWYAEDERIVGVVNKNKRILPIKP